MTAKTIASAASLSIILSMVKGETRVNTRVLDEQLSNKHKNSVTLIERYLDKFKEFGVVPFQTEKPSSGIAGGRPERFALLNEDQTFFLLSLSRNTTRVVELKANLIMAFREARLRCAQLELEARKNEASTSGRRLARWRYDKPMMYRYIESLSEQLGLPFEQEGICYDRPQERR